MAACGLDFGTSNTTLGLVTGQRPQLVPLEGRHVTIPSAIFFPPGQAPFVGRAAMAEYLEGTPGRLMRSLKSVLGSSLLEETTPVGRERIRFRDVIARYLAALDRADREGNDVPEARTQRIGEKIAALRRQMAFLREMQGQVEAADDGQVSLTDPDARSMATSGRGTGIVGYNVQIAVDPEHHLVVAHEVVNEGHDRTQLVPMGGRAKQAIGAEEVTVLADRGYYSGDEVLACEGTGVLPAMPRADTSGRAKKGLFVRADFVYDAAADHYVCPAGAVLTKSNARSDRHGDIDHYRNLDACHACAMRVRCTTEKFKRFKRWKHEAVLEAMQRRLDAMPDAMAIRRATVEHVFGTLKAWMGSTPFLTKGLKGVRTEMSLAILAYNMKRMIRLFGATWLMQAIRA